MYTLYVKPLTASDVGCSPVDNLLRISPVRICPHIIWHLIQRANELLRLMDSSFCNISYAKICQQLAVCLKHLPELSRLSFCRDQQAVTHCHNQLQHEMAATLPLGKAAVPGGFCGRGCIWASYEFLPSPAASIHSWVHSILSKWAASKTNTSVLHIEITTASAFVLTQ